MKICVASSTYPPGPTDDDRPTVRAPYESSPALQGIVELTSQVRIRAVARNTTVQERRKKAAR